jgi:hypothetical protein
MFNNKDTFKINITVTLQVMRETPAPAARTARPLFVHRVVGSSVIESVMYDADKRHLYITFVTSGDTYRYDRVEFYVLQELLAAKSAGQYFSRYIRDAYTTHKILGTV